jgi:hypothetical protein
VTEQSPAALRSARQKGYYKVQFSRTETNKKRRVARHLKAHPMDTRAADYYERKRSFGPVSALRWTAKGFKRHARATAAIGERRASTA